MFKKTYLALALQVVVLGTFLLLALGSGESSSITPKEAYDAGAQIGSGMRTLYDGFNN